MMHMHVEYGQDSRCIEIKEIVETRFPNFWQNIMSIFFKTDKINPSLS